jgi:HipA-like protein
MAKYLAAVRQGRQNLVTGTQRSSRRKYRPKSRRIGLATAVNRAFSPSRTSATLSDTPVIRPVKLERREFPPEAATAHRFFANLLPEGGVREQIARDLKLPDSDFELLHAIGGECAGALSILSSEREPSWEQHYHPLSDEELARLAARRGRIYTAGLEEATTQPLLQLVLVLPLVDPIHPPTHHFQGCKAVEELPVVRVP